jgi:ribosome-associated translation inhibitor RaiA
MQIDIQSREFSLTGALHDYAERRLRFSLTSSNSYIQRVKMRLSDINGPRGGADKRCHIQIVLTGLPDIIIEDIEADMYVAIGRAADRAGRSVLRKVRRQQTMLRQGQVPRMDMN